MVDKSWTCSAQRHGQDFPSFPKFLFRSGCCSSFGMASWIKCCLWKSRRVSQERLEALGEMVESRRRYKKQASSKLISRDNLTRTSRYKAVSNLFFLLSFPAIGPASFRTTWTLHFEAIQPIVRTYRMKLVLLQFK